MLGTLAGEPNQCQPECPAPTLWATLQQGFWNRRTHAERLMWPDPIVLSEPGVDDGLGLIERRATVHSGFRPYAANAPTHP